MAVELENSHLILLIQQPGFPYKEARFDYTGQIIQITFLGKHTFCTTEKTGGLEINSKGRGLYNEFGIDKPVGYDDTPVNGKFPKIGVGDLTRNSKKPYNFFDTFDIEPYIFACSVEKDSASFVCETRKNEEYGFKLEKVIKLVENSFTIDYCLSNTGEKVISTNEYIHNFLCINERMIDETYKLFFPSPCLTEKFIQHVNPENTVQLKENYIKWNRVPAGEFFLTNNEIMNSSINSWQLINYADKVGIEECVDFNVEKIHLWGSGHVISPELFFSFTVFPGQKIQWSRVYRVFTVD